MEIDKYIRVNQVLLKRVMTLLGLSLGIFLAIMKREDLIKEP